MAVHDIEKELPVIDLDVFLTQPRDSPSVAQECKKAADALIIYGALVLHDSRVATEDNDTFLDLIEDYFAQPEELLRKDERPELSWQVGVTLENTEKPKCAVDEPCLRVIERLAPSERPLDIMGHNPDPKCRFFWRMSEPPPYPTEFPGLNASNVVPEAPELKERWTPTMMKWGSAMKTSVADLTEMVAIGLGLPAETFRKAGQYGPHLLAPTASDLVKFGEKDTILAGFHTDLNFLTIHGRSRYPGLHIWGRNTGNKIPVKIPPGNNLLVQAGKQLEHITGGLVRAGFHEVVVNDATLAVIEKRKKEFPDRPLIRISSTLFWHLSSDEMLAPIPELLTRAQALRQEYLKAGMDDDNEPSYPPMKVGTQVQHELSHIALLAA
ncbi:Clavaminate synthase-like protein [Coprinellus micaceus]|uniref:Clavaminate synthase-like protein n=1 Tax=Coprinellus micaceus TaxID=71717 RepID=A0A4Y7TXI3_COPMI|nr:Clavaminate synthase-like protein [Coprinellus micaceus]